MKKLLIGFVALTSLSAFAQQTVILRSSEVVSIQCQDGGVLKQLNSSVRSTTFSCVKACTVTLKTSSRSWGGSTGYCTEIKVPRTKFGVYSDCGNPLNSRDAAIQRGMTSANNELLGGHCDEIITVGF